MEPLISDFPAASEDREFQTDLFQQKITNEENRARIEETVDVTHRYNLRQSRSDWGARYVDHYTTPVVLTNLIPKAMKLYGTETLPNAMKEVSQLHEKHVWTSIKHDSIVNKAKIIRSLIFLKPRRDGSLKARMVADGRMQDRDNEQDVSSPTVSTESLFLLADESRRVITVDIEGAFLHSVMTNVIYMEISGQCVDVLIYMYGDIYVKDFYNNKIYVMLDRALYGTIEAAKVWYDTLSS